VITRAQRIGAWLALVAGTIGTLALAIAGVDEEYSSLFGLGFTLLVSALSLVLALPGTALVASGPKWSVLAFVGQTALVSGVLTVLVLLLLTQLIWPGQENEIAILGAGPFGFMGGCLCYGAQSWVVGRRSSP
jgi:hypothetical protein